MSFQYNTATSFSDETYLESFIEAVSWTLPSDVQRSLQHLQMLDNEGSKLMKQWRDTQDSCLHGVEMALLGAYTTNNRGGHHDAPINPGTPSDNNNINNSSNSNYNTNNTSATKKSPASSERKKACYKCRNKKVKCDGKQSFCLFKEEYSMMGLNNTSEGRVDNATTATSDYYSPPQKKSKLSNDTDNGTTTQQSSSLVATLPKLDITRPPTAAELRTALQARNPHYIHQRQSITNMYHQIQQCSREKIHTANQLKSMIDMALGRLSRDMNKFEQDLGLPSSSSCATIGGGRGAVLFPAAAASSSNQPSIMGGGGDASAIMTTSAAINTTTTTGGAELLQATTTTVPSSSSLVLPPNTTSTTTKDLAAIQTTPNSPDWILAKIISYNKYTKMYTLSDEDMASDEIYTIPERQVRPLLGSKKWTKGEPVYAVYPDTTSFYPATVNCMWNGHVMVHFNDDWDASGVIHEKAIPLHHVMKAP
jgi:hypothetical protein